MEMGFSTYAFAKERNILTSPNEIIIPELHYILYKNYLSAQRMFIKTCDATRNI